MKKITESDIKNIVHKYLLNEVRVKNTILFEDEKHVQQLFTKWANRKSGNPEKALSLMDDFLKYQKIIKRDFTTFNSVEELEQSINDVKTKINKKIEKNSVDKVFENPDVLIIVAKNHETNCRYGAGTKWCTTMRSRDNEWVEHNRTGTEFIWILKKLSDYDPNYKISLHLKYPKGSDWCNAENFCSTKVPEVIKNLIEYDMILSKCNEYHNQRFKNKKIKNKGWLDEISYLVEDEFDMFLEDSLFSLIDNDVIDEDMEKEILDYMSREKGNIIQNIMSVVSIDLDKIENEGGFLEYKRNDIYDIMSDIFLEKITGY